MRTTLILTILTLVLLFFAGCEGTMNNSSQSQMSKTSQNQHVLIVTGGHGFEEEPFFAMFDDMDDIEYTHAALKETTEVFNDISDWSYDVIVLYTMTQNITEQQKANFLSLLNDGVGLVVMHHAIANYQDWPEHRKIIGGQYFTKDMMIDGVQWKRCLWQHDVDMNVKVEDPDHPVTAGLSDFAILDESYKGYMYTDDNHLLLSTDQPLNNPTLCWTRTYANSRVCVIQLGHDSGAYNNPNFQKLLRQAITYCAPAK